MMVLDPTAGGLLPFETDEARPLLCDAGTGRWMSLGEVRAFMLAAGQRMAAPRKRLVFLLAGNRPDTVIALLGIIAAGHAVALIDPLQPSGALEALIAAYAPDIVIAPGTLADLPVADGGWTLDEADGLAIARRDRDDASPVFPDLMLLLSTSGTTGSSKFVRLSRTAILANARQIAQVLEIGQSDVAAAHLPLHYSYGLSVVTSHLVSGARIAIVDDAVTSPGFWAKAGAAGATHFPGVPFHYTVLARLGLDLVPASVETFTQAGGVLDPRFQTILRDKIDARGGRFYIMYGQTEAAPRMTTLPHARLWEKQGSVGPALPGGRLSVLGEDGRPCGPGETGTVVYEGPNVMMGYATGRADLALGDVQGGRLETGDLGRLDADGYLTLQGRTKRFAKIAGLRLGLDDIEAEAAPFAQSACLDAGEKILVCHEGGDATALKAHFKALSVRYRIPPASFALRPFDTLPRKPSGKIDYARLKDLCDV